MIHRYDAVFDHEEIEAVRAAIRLGAFAARAEQLRSVIDNQRKQGYGQLADNAERELEMLDRGADTILRMKQVSP